MMNVAVLTVRDRALTGLLNTAASVFAETLVWHPEGSRNWIVVASEAPGLAGPPRPQPRADTEEVRREFVRDIRAVAFDPSGPVFTDDLSPLEIYTDLLFLRHLAAAGGP